MVCRLDLVISPLPLSNSRGVRLWVACLARIPNVAIFSLQQVRPDSPRTSSPLYLRPSFPASPPPPPPRRPASRPDAQFTFCIFSSLATSTHFLPSPQTVSFCLWLLPSTKRSFLPPPSLQKGPLLVNQISLPRTPFRPGVLSPASVHHSSARPRCVSHLLPSLDSLLPCFS